jgi:hypothetical protein
MFIPEIIDGDFGRIAQKIYSANLNSVYFQSGAFLQVFDKPLLILWLYQINLFVNDRLARLVAGGPEIFDHQRYQHQHDVCEKQLHIADLFVGKGIHYRDTNHQKKIGHLLDGDGIRAVADDAKQGEKPEGKSQLQIDILQQMRQKEDADADEDVGEKVLLTTVVGVINIAYDDERKDQVDREPEGQHQKVEAIEKLDPEKLRIVDKMEQ